MPKPGYRTTEFYATLAALLVAALVAFGIVSQEDAPGLETAITDALAAIISLAVAARVVVEYIRNRTAVKLNGARRPDIR
jgi:ribosomal protein S11